MPKAGKALQELALELVTERRRVSALERENARLEAALVEEPIRQPVERLVCR